MPAQELPRLHRLWEAMVLGLNRSQVATNSSMPSAVSRAMDSSATTSKLRPSHPRSVALALPSQSWRRVAFRCE